MKFTFLYNHTTRLALIVLVMNSVSLGNGYTDGDSWLQTDIRHAFYTGAALVHAPLQFEKKQWCELASTAAITVLLFSMDKDAKQLFLRQQSSLNDDLFGIDRFHGSQYSLLASLGIYGYGLGSGNSTIRRLGLQASEAFVYSGVITNVLKIVVGRRRPFAGESQLVFKSIQAGTDNTYLSLPSGHTTAAFSVSTVLASYSPNLVWKSLCYGSAGLVGAARIYHNRHWLSDVFLGGMIGYQVGKFVTHQDVNQSGETWIHSVRPVFSSQGVGFSISF